jgi:sigma-B regulation protein RsbU (phosphoserine phosphatase)
VYLSTHSSAQLQAGTVIALSELYIFNAISPLSAIMTNETPMYPQRLLIVDDEPNVRRAIKRLFRREQWKISEASSGQEALTEMHGTDFNLVISDLKMPVMDGIEFLAIAKKAFPDTSQMMISGHAGSSELAAAINACNIDTFLTKPWSSDDLIKNAQQSMLNNCQQRQLSLSHASVSAEVKAAAELQFATLPPPISAPDLRVDWLFQACTTLGGDGFGYQRRDHQLDFYLLDVVGHGVAAAMESFALQQTLNRADMRHPAQVATKMNTDYAYRDDPMHYFTLLCGNVDLNSGHVTYCQAGHPSPIRVGDSAIVDPGQGGLPIGIIDAADYQEQIIELAPGDSLLLHSDGFASHLDVSLQQWLTENKNMAALHRNSLMDSLMRWRHQQPIDDDVSAILLTLPTCT